MYFNPKDVKICLEHAQEIAGYYKTYVLESPYVKKSIDGLKWMVEEYEGKNFNIWQLDIPVSSVSAMYQANANGTYDIYVMSGLGELDRRFAVTKELFHVVLDQQACRSVEIYDHLEEVTATFPVAHSHPNCAAQWEVLAEAAAMEFLFSYEERVQCLAAANGQIDFEALSERYGIPLRFVEGYLSDAHMDFFSVFS